MKKKLIIFDLDGTILNTGMDLTNALNFALQHHDRDIYSVDEVMHTTGKGMKVLLKEAMGKCDDETLEKAYFEFKEFYELFPYLFTKPYDKVKETLDDLKLKGYKLAVVSNKDDLLTNKIINHFFKGIFDFVTGAKEDLPLKPDKALVELCLNTLNISKEEALYVGDSSIDYLTATNSGVDHMGVTYGFRSKEELIESGAINLEDSITGIYKYI